MSRSLLSLATSRVEKLGISVPEFLSYQYEEQKRKNKIQHILDLIPFDQNEQMYEIAKIATYQEFIDFLDTHPYACNLDKLLKGIVEGDNLQLFGYYMTELLEISTYVDGVFTVINIDSFEKYIHMVEPSHPIWETYVIPFLEANNIEYSMYLDTNVNVCTYACVFTWKNSLWLSSNSRFIETNIRKSSDSRASSIVLSSGSVELFHGWFAEKDLETLSIDDLGYACIGGVPEIIDIVLSKIIESRNGVDIGKFGVVTILNGAALNNKPELFLSLWNTYSNYNVTVTDNSTRQKKDVKIADCNIGGFKSTFLHGSLKLNIFYLLCREGICNNIHTMLDMYPDITLDEDLFITEATEDMFRWIIDLNERNGATHYSPNTFSSKYTTINNILILNEKTGFTYDELSFNVESDADQIELIRRFPRLLNDDSEVMIIEPDLENFDPTYQFIKNGNIEAFKKYYKLYIKHQVHINTNPEYDDHEAMLTEERIYRTNKLLINSLEELATDISEYLLVNGIFDKEITQKYLQYKGEHLLSNKLVMRTIGEYLLAIVE